MDPGSPPPCPEQGQGPGEWRPDPDGLERLAAAAIDAPEVVPLLSPSCGTGELFVRARAGLRTEVYERLLSFRSDPWDTDGRQPVVWHSARDFPNWKSVFFVAAARDVEVSWVARAERPGVRASKGSMAPTPSTVSLRSIPEVRLCRVESRDDLPFPGDPFRISEIVGAPLHQVAGRILDWPPPAPMPDTEPEPVATWSGSMESALDSLHRWVQLRRSDHVVIRPDPEGIRFDHAGEDWSVDVRRLDARVRGGHAWELLYLGRGPDDWTERYELRVIHTPGYQVQGTQLRRAVRVRPPSTVTVRVAEVSFADLPARGTPLPSWALDRARSLELPVRPGPVMAGTIELTVALVGLVPVVGTLIDLAHLAFMQAYGVTFWGSDVDEEQLALEGAFALLGVVADARDAARLVEASHSLFKNAPGTLVLPNPGLVPPLVWTVERTADPVLLDTARALAPEARDAVIGALQRRADAAIDFTGWVSVFDEQVFRPYRTALDEGLIPDSVYRDAWSAIDPVRLDGFDDLPAATQYELLDLVAAAREPGMEAARSAARLVQDLDPALRADFDDLFDAWRVSRVLNPFFDAFNSRVLSELYGEYARLKRLRGGTPLSPVAWAAHPRRWLGRAHEELLRLLGPGYKDVLRRIADEEYWTVGKTLVDAIRDSSLLVVPQRYERLRALNPDGRVLEADHVLEKRFQKTIARYVEGRHELEPGQFQALLVPKNAAVARQLEREGVFHHYVHLEKTRLMNRLIPHGAEKSYSFQEIFEAHVIVLHHQLGLPRDMVQSLVLDEMRHALEILDVKIVDTSWMTLEGLMRRNPRFAAVP